MQTRNVGYFCLFYILFILGCTDANPKVSSLHALDEFTFNKNFILTADMSSIPLQAKCSRFIERIDVSFDDGTTWMTTSSYDATAQIDCANSNYAVTLSNSKSPWNSMTFTNGQVVTVKFRAMSRVGYYIYREISVKFTPSTTIRQEVLAGTGTSTGTNVILKGRIRSQNQSIASDGSVIIRGRILE